MPTITLRHQQTTESGFVATLSIDGQTHYSVTVQDPFTEAQERELEFYFEQWIRFPFDNQVIAQRAAASVQTYGESLFEQLFSDRRAYADYGRACSGGLSQLQVDIEGDSPDFQALHWEALKDPDHPTPLATEAIFTRKRFQSGGVSVTLAPSPVINLLVVTARPDEEDDVGYRTISRPLIEAIHRAQLRVKVEILRPGTFEALSRHLENKDGHYHIVHFDAHGGLMTYDQFEAGVTKDRYTYRARYGRPEMERYTGQKAFLFFEGEAKGKADPVEAEELAKLLTNRGIPICILNACQSAKQVKSTPVGAHSSASTPDPLQNTDPLQSTETSLGSRLMAAGVQMVVAMGYSVTVTAAQVMMEKLYAELFAQRGIPEAIRLGRKELYNRKERKVYFNQMVPLEDWLLPVVYANRPVDLALREFAPAEKAEYLTQRAQRYRFEAPTYGFVGRDLEILKIEKALLRHNVLLVQGMGGTGKTTLLNYLRDWWQTTHFVNDVFYFGYDKTAYTLPYILRDIGKTLYPDPYAFATFEAMPAAAQLEDVAEQLRAQPYALMLDNLESVTGQALAIPNTLPEAEQAQIHRFLQRLVGGHTKVVLGSRSGEDWLADTYTHEGQANLYTLGGLDPESRTELADKILIAQVGDTQRIATLQKDADFKRLMTLLAGYPLAMEVVLANLATQSPKAILAALQAADVDLNVGGNDKTNNILKCVEYSHSNLSPQAQKLLVCLAPFNSFIDRADLENYGKQLQQHEPFKDYYFSQFDTAIQEAINWGLLSPHESGIPGCLTIQPIFPYFLRTKLNTLNSATHNALYDGFKAHYQGLAGSYQQWMDSKDPNQRQLGLMFCRLEYENLYVALKICLEKQESVDIFLCLFDFLRLSQDISSTIKLSEFVTQIQEKYPLEIRVGKIGLEIVMTLDRLAYCYMTTQNYQKARSTYEKVLNVILQLREVSDNQIKSALASTYHQLGRVAQELREYEQARAHYQQALDIYIEFNDRYEQAGTYHQLGIVAEDLREYEQARAHYQQALDIFIEFNDRYTQATVYHQLGIVAQEMREYEQARAYYQQALDIKIEFNDRYSQARTYHQLGMVAEVLREYEQARAHYQQALDIYIEFNDRYSQASTYHNLGIVVQDLREYEQARAHYQQALDICIEFNDRYSQARTYHQLGIVVQDLREYEQARAYYQQALDICIEFNDRYNQARIYHQLGIVAQDLREYEQARAHYQQALDIKIEFNDRYSQASTYRQLGLLAEAQEDYAQAQQHLQQALTIFVEFNDQQSVAQTVRNLARLYQTTQDDSLLAAVAQCLGTTPAQVQERFAANRG
ncbi:tetratricopeptide repeat protein [Phormidium sp. FACHB-1136]|nr:tetratricopeptide repeat protein [Phormidium sp. FACHB-1136]